MTGTPRLWRFGEDPAPLRELLARGGILAIPTESSYGLAADPRNPVGVEAIFAAKGRAASKPLPVVVAGVSQLPDLGIATDSPAVAGAQRWWPAALSVLLPFEATPEPSPGLPAAAGADSLAVRVPARPDLRELLAVLGPLTATSANLSGQPPILEPFAALELLRGCDAMVIDGGRLPGGAPSTLVEWTAAGWRVLRAGSFSHPQLFSATTAADQLERTRMERHD
jgi:L-threonylcarbamoyladenylate synthase